MSVRPRIPKFVCLLMAVSFSARLLGQSNYVLTPQGGEFSILGSIPGDQVWPSVALSPSGGCLAWYDSVRGRTVPSIGGALLDASFNAGPIFRVNAVIPPAARAALMPKVGLLTGNQTLFAWQSSAAGTPDIYVRLAKNAKNSGAYGTNFYTADLRMNTYLPGAQIEPAVAALSDGSAIVTWSSWGQDGSMFGVYARRLLANGHAATPREFQVNQSTAYNQRSPAVAALPNGNYVIVWTSENERRITSAVSGTAGNGADIDVYARIFSNSGVPQTDEIPVNTGTYPCGAPAVAPLSDGGFTVVWAQKDLEVPTNSWDIYGCAFTSTGSPSTTNFLINTYQYGDQYQPKIAAGPAGSMVVWTSLGEDGSREGVYGRFLQGGTEPVGSELRVNTTTISQQMHQDVAWDGVGRFLVVWTSFTGGSGFDLYGQAYGVTSQ